MPISEVPIIITGIIRVLHSSDDDLFNMMDRLTAGDVFPMLRERGLSWEYAVEIGTLAQGITYDFDGTVEEVRDAQPHA